MLIPKFVQSAKFWNIFHGVRLVAYAILWILASIFGWIHSITFISHISMIALVEGAMAAFQGARSEKKAENDNNEG